MNTESEPSDTRADLIEQFQEQGFRRGFDFLWSHHHARLGRFVRGRGLEAAGAEDAVQDTAVKLFPYLSGHVVDIFPATAFKIVKDHIANHYRAAGRSPVLETLDDLIATGREPTVDATEPHHKVWDELRAMMDAGDVPPDQQTAIILHKLIGYTVEEVAQITEAKYETVKSRLRYATVKLGRIYRHQEVT